MGQVLRWVLCRENATLDCVDLYFATQPSTQQCAGNSEFLRIAHLRQMFSQRTTNDVIYILLFILTHTELQFKK